MRACLEGGLTPGCGWLNLRSGAVRRPRDAGIRADNHAAPRPPLHPPAPSPAAERAKAAEKAAEEREKAAAAAELKARGSAANLAKLSSDAAAKAAAAAAAAAAPAAALVPAAPPRRTMAQLVREAAGSREPLWAHESLLPLWLVKGYEERVRGLAGRFGVLACLLGCCQFAALAQCLHECRAA